MDRDRLGLHGLVVVLHVRALSRDPPDDWNLRQVVLACIMQPRHVSRRELAFSDDFLVDRQQGAWRAGAKLTGFQWPVSRRRSVVLFAGPKVARIAELHGLSLVGFVAKRGCTARVAAAMIE